MYLKTHSTDLPWDEPSDEQLAWEEENLEEDLDGTPQEFSALELRNMSSDELESLLDEAPIGSVIHNIYDNWWTKKKLKDGKEPTESIVEKHRGYKQNYYAPVPTKDRITWWTVGGSEKHKFDLIKIILGKNKYYTVSDGETFDLNEAKYTRDELFDKFGTDDLDIINAGNEEVVELAADGDGALVEQLQKILKHNKSLEEQVKKLQEKISVGYAKEIELKEELDSYKQKVTKLSEKTKEIKVLNEKLSKAENKLEESMKTAADNTSTLNESIKSKEQSNKKLEKNIANLNEAIDKKNIKIRSLNEEINKYKAEIDSKNTDIEQLKEQFETGQKDLEQLKNQYSKKLEKQNKIIEKYQRVAKNSVKRYIESQAVRLGVKSDEIINRLPKNYSFNDIDMICEDLQEYKFNMSNLPFGQYGLNEGMKVTAKNISKAPVENPADEITDYDLKIAEAFL
jgi:methyl-accepting chemotaxis protein